MYMARSHNVKRFLFNANKQRKLSQAQGRCLQPPQQPVYTSTAGNNTQVLSPRTRCQSTWPSQDQS